MRVWPASAWLATSILMTGLADVALLGRQSTGVALQKDIRKALDEQWHGWELATVDARALACRPDGSASPAVVQGDFDDDGRGDAALLIKTSQGVRLVAAFTRVDDVLVFDVDSLGDTTADGYLGLEPRGAKFINPHTNLDDYFGADTPAVYRCDGSRVAYLWSGVGFTKLEIPEGALTHLAQHRLEIDGLPRPQLRPEISDVLESSGRGADREVLRVEAPLDLLPCQGC
jgi:hypothetical protein